MKESCLFLVLLFIVAVATADAAERVRSYYKVSHISQSVVGISCPGNGGDPTVVTNVSGTLLISCGR